jgi:hypothetical protein
VREVGGVEFLLTQHSPLLEQPIHEAPAPGRGGREKPVHQDHLCAALQQAVCT